MPRLHDAQTKQQKHKRHAAQCDQVLESEIKSSQFDEKRRRFDDKRRHHKTQKKIQTEKKKKKSNVFVSKIAFEKLNFVVFLLVSKPLLILIEGNISAGKSTLAQELEKKLNYRVFLEPTLSNPYLEDFYKDQKAFALKMQLWLLRNRFRTYITALRHIAETGQGVILDRSVFSDWVFAEKNRIDENIDTVGFAYYMDLRTQMLAHLPIPHVTVYLDVDAKTCYDRVHNMRGRDCESGIPLAYLQGLGECYQEFTAEMTRAGSQVLTVDWNEFGNVQDVVAAIDATTDKAALAVAAGGMSDELRELLMNEERVLQLMRPPTAEPKEYADWYVQETETNQWDPNLEYVLEKKAQQNKSDAMQQENEPSANNAIAAN